jgi:hypothetical protein
MNEYARISLNLKEETDKNEELHLQVQQRVDEMLIEFWKLKPMLKTVEYLELTPDIMAAWIKSRQTKQG